MDKFASDAINVREFLKLSVQKLNHLELNNIGNGNYQKHLESADMDVFKTDDFLPKSKLTPRYFDEVVDTCGLEVLKEMKEKLSKDRKISKVQRTLRKKAIRFDIALYDSPHHHRLLNDISRYRHRQNSSIIQEADVVISVHFYRANRQVLEKYMDFDVLGQMPLTALRDKLCCFSDHIAIGDYSKDLKAPTDKVAKDVLKSGFFFIEGIFYNDMRHPESKDLSQAILSNKKPELPSFPTKLMEDSKFIDLTLRLNQPYLYRHLGECEHVIIFSDIRLVTDEDCRYIDEYPIQTYEVRASSFACRLCENRAQWMAVNSSISPQDPCLYCDVCLKAAHYDEEDTLIDPGVKIYCYPKNPENPLYPDNDDDDDGDGDCDDDDDDDDTNDSDSDDYEP